MYIYVLSTHVGWDVTKISSWRILVQQVGRESNSYGFLFGSIFLPFFFHFFFHVDNSQGNPPALDARFHTRGYCSYRSVSCDFKDNFMVLVLFPLPP